MSATAAEPTVSQAVRVEVDGPTAVLTLDNPKRRNALSVATMTELTAALRDVAGRDGVRAIVLRAEGPAFSAGHDLSEMVDRTLEEEREVFAVCTDLMTALHAVPQPVIAAVQGVAVAAGCQLVAACDLAIAAEGAVFGTPGVKIGLFCSTPMVAVTRAIGRKRAMQLLLTGETIDAATAADWGLVNQVVAAGELDAAARTLAAKVADASAVTLSIGKEAFYRQVDLPEDAAYEAMRETMATNAMTRDAQEGMSAFLAKRAPIWQHHD
ncbi:enoyl-CoA hydratase [Actinomycetospora aeridis]|uniref:Enoyl-CoA hydratase domain-containing protein 3, mitochondrial n=1 Tax=Actinomycetospora aeridis TaxID=3129231 RepID=A0ABU8N5C7_9PSEU